MDGPRCGLILQISINIMFAFHLISFIILLNKELQETSGGSFCLVFNCNIIALIWVIFVVVSMKCKNLHIEDKVGPPGGLVRQDSTGIALNTTLAHQA